MRLGERETRARRDAQIRGAEAFMADELDDDHLARHFDGWVRHEYHMHPPTDPCKVCCTDEIERLQAERRATCDHLDRIEDICRSAGIEDHHGGMGETYYRRPVWHMVEELASFVDGWREQTDRADELELALCAPNSFAYCQACGIVSSNDDGPHDCPVPAEATP